MNAFNNNDSAMDIIAQALKEMKSVQGDNFSYTKVNLVQLERMAGLSRLRTLKKASVYGSISWKYRKTS